MSANCPSRACDDEPVQQRPATADDLELITALTIRSDTAWFGAPEHDEAEVREYFDQVGDPESGSRLFFDGDRLVAAAFGNATDTLVGGRP